MDKPNDFRSIWLRWDRQRRQDLADKLGTSYAYLQKIAGGFGKPSLDFAQRMKAEIPRLDLAGFGRAAQDAGRRVQP